MTKCLLALCVAVGAAGPARAALQTRGVGPLVLAVPSLKTAQSLIPDRAAALPLAAWEKPALQRLDQVASGMIEKGPILAVGRAGGVVLVPQEREKGEGAVFVPQGRRRALIPISAKIAGRLERQVESGNALGARNTLNEFFDAWRRRKGWTGDWMDQGGGVPTWNGYSPREAAVERAKRLSTAEWKGVYRGGKVERYKWVDVNGPVVTTGEWTEIQRDSRGGLRISRKAYPRGAAQVLPILLAVEAGNKTLLVAWRRHDRFDGSAAGPEVFTLEGRKLVRWAEYGRYEDAFTGMKNALRVRRKPYLKQIELPDGSYIRILAGKGGRLTLYRIWPEADPAKRTVLARFRAGDRRWAVPMDSVGEIFALRVRKGAEATAGR